MVDRHRVRRSNGLQLPPEGKELVERARRTSHLNSIESREDGEKQFAACGVTIYDGTHASGLWPPQLVVSWVRVPPTDVWHLAAGSLYHPDNPTGAHAQRRDNALALIEEFFNTYG